MRVAVTGTPGTGKTTATEHLETALDVIHLNDVVREEGLVLDHDEDRDSAIVDLDATRAWLADRDDVVVESHLAHHFPADRVVVLRAHPEAIQDRLTEREGDSVDDSSASESDSGGANDATDEPARDEATGEPAASSTAVPTAPGAEAVGESARENAEAEALDVVLTAAVERHGLDAVYEVDTTDRDPAAVASAIEDVLEGRAEPSAGTVDYLSWLEAGGDRT